MLSGFDSACCCLGEQDCGVENCSATAGILLDLVDEEEEEDEGLVEDEDSGVIGLTPYRETESEREREGEREI